MTRYRKSLIGERAQEANRLHKVLETANIKLGMVATDVLGTSGRRMLEAILHGERDPVVLSEFAMGKLRRKLPELRRALEGRVLPHHLILIEQILAHVEFLDESIERLGQEIDIRLAPFEEEARLLQTIPGVSEAAAATIIAEIGTDISILGRYPCCGHGISC